jgi:hypothetical protein
MTATALPAVPADLAAPAAALLSPFALGPLCLPNRIVMAPLTRARADRHGIPSRLAAEYYAQRASAGLIVTQKQLISEVWGPDKLGDTRGLRSYIKHLRQKLEVDPRQPRFLLTEAGVGYRLIVEDMNSLG